jgi:hypothetical protein
MVYSGAMSRGCQRCRQRKIKASLVLMAKQYHEFSLVTFEDGQAGILPVCPTKYRRAETRNSHVRTSAYMKMPLTEDMFILDSAE